MIPANPAPQPAAPEQAERIDRLLVDNAPSPGLQPTGPAAPLSIQYTSGTTSRPKAVLWTHANALWAARTSATHEGLRAYDVHHCVLPLFHTNALSYSWLACLWAGATLVLQPAFHRVRFGTLPCGTVAPGVRSPRFATARWSMSRSRRRTPSGTGASPSRIRSSSKNSASGR